MTKTKPTKTKRIPCDRCGGTGRMPFKVYQGICLRCHGDCVDPKYRDWEFPADWTADQIAAFREALIAKNQKARERRQAKIDAAADGIFAANVVACPALAELAEIDPVQDILRAARRRELSEKQRGFVSVLVDRAKAAKAREARREAQEAAKAALVASGVKAPEGRKEIEGQVVAEKWVEQTISYGYRGRVIRVRKIVVKSADGWSVWVSVPSEIYDVAVGEVVRLTATLERSDKDPLFAFGKRPSKAVILNRAKVVPQVEGGVV